MAEDIYPALETKKDLNLPFDLVVQEPEALSFSFISTTSPPVKRATKA